MTKPQDSSRTVVSLPASKSAPAPNQAAAGLQRELPVNQLAPDPDQPRKHFAQEALRALAESINAVGLINRLTVRKVPTLSPITGEMVPWRIVSGERRWRAMQMLGRITVGVEVIATDDRETAALSLIENTCRADLNLLEKAMAVRRLHQEFGYNQSEIAPMIQVGDRTRVSKLLAVLDLPETLHPYMADGLLSWSHAEILLRLPSRDQGSIGLQSITEGWSSRRLAQVVEAAARKKPGLAKAAAKPADEHDEHRLWLQNKLSEHLCTSVKLRPGAKGSKGDLVIHYADNDVLQGILERLGYSEDN